MCSHSFLPDHLQLVITYSHSKNAPKCAGKCELYKAKIPTSVTLKHVENITGCHAGHQEAGRCCTKGESEESAVHRQGNMQARESTLAFETQSRHHQKSKIGISVAPQNGLVSYKIFTKQICCLLRLKGRGGVIYSGFLH